MPRRRLRQSATAPPAAASSWRRARPCRRAPVCAARPSATCCGRCAWHADMRIAASRPAPAAADHGGHGVAAGGEVGGAGARRRWPDEADAGRRRAGRRGRPPAPAPPQPRRAGRNRPDPARADRHARADRPAPAEPPISDSERALLLDLRGRRAELDAQDAALAAREAALGAAEKRLTAPASTSWTPCRSAWRRWRPSARAQTRPTGAAW